MDSLNGRVEAVCKVPQVQLHAKRDRIVAVVQMLASLHVIKTSGSCYTLTPLRSQVAERHKYAALVSVEPCLRTAQVPILCIGPTI